ncbi:MAG: ABC transporter permease [Armatimonadota bacterium]|nr:ABC transporter permease [Armatimonadota bacterium]MDR7427601.1 ABC transporter permease [Armatimonadota bacterium]MDR7464872.1 ABC transporter permease [Armatimonadota bacterium]MDR7469569.1 ABC transporter permease [Armatimonadota bacterium]MDR7475863.1 ABC transporter permease [Armatimonadota bacterium]
MSSAVTVAEAVRPRPRTAAGVLLRRLWRDRRATVGLAVLVLAVLSAVFAPVLAPYDPQFQSDALFQAPSLRHWLGTDDLGRDLLSRIIFGSRISLVVGITTVGLAALLGVLLGVLSGYYGGWVDMLVMRYIDLQWAFPNFIIAVALVAVFGTGLENVIVAVTLAFLDDFARITRGMVLALREEDFVAAARAVGAGDRRIMLRHILPNASSPIIVQGTVSISYAILAEAGLSFLGLGVKPTTPTWGLILNDARPFFQSAWWLGIFPGLAIMLVVLSINFVGDGLRDLLDVKEYQGLRG